MKEQASKAFSKDKTGIYLDRYHTISPGLFEILNALHTYSDTGAQLVRWAAEVDAGLHICNFPENMGGYTEVQDGKIQIALNENNPPLENINHLAHELIHGVQAAQWGVIDPDFYYTNARDGLFYTLAMEAGAQICATRALFEMKCNGQPSAFDHFYISDEPNIQKYNILNDVFEKTYHRSRQNNATHTLALTEAGDAAFTAYFKNHQVSDDYRIVQLYYQMIIPYLHLNAPDQIKEIKTVFNTENAHDMARLPDGNHFITADAVKFVTDADIYGEDPLIRQAGDYTDLQTIQCRETKSTKKTSQLRNKMSEDGNPYLDIPYKRVIQTFQSFSRIRIPVEYHTLTALNQLSGHNLMSQSRLPLSLTARPKHGPAPV